MNKKLIFGMGIALIAIVTVGIILALVLFGMKGGFKKDSSSNSSNTSTYVCEEGDTIKIPIKFNSNPGMIAAKTVVNFDSSVFEYVDCEAGFFSDCQAKADDGKVTCLMMATVTKTTKDIKMTGTAATLVFKVKTGVKKGTYFMSVNEEKSEYANLNEQYVSPDVSVPNKITIK